MPGLPGERGGGRVTTVTPEERVQARQVSARRVLRLFTPHRRQLGVVISIIVASSVVGLASPFLLRAVVDVAIPQRNLRLLVWLASGMVGIAALTAVFDVLQTWISTRVGQSVMHRLRVEVFSHLQRQSMTFFTATRAGEVQSRITNDIGGMQTVVTSTATSIASNATITVATAVAMVALSWRLALISLVVMPPAVYFTRKVASLRRAITAAQQRELAELNVTIEESLSVDGARLAKILGNGPALIERFTVSSERLTRYELHSQLAGRWRMASLSVVFAAVPAVIYVGAGLPTTAGTMTIGTLIAFTTLQASLFRPVIGLLNTSVAVVSSMALMARIFEYLDLPVEVAEPADPTALNVDRVAGELRFDGVDFAYPGSRSKALDGIDLVVPAGSTLALVGATGSGKSTLGSLVARLVDPTEGSVTVDGIDLRDLRGGDLSRVVGVVSQDTYLLHASVRENLRYARPEATDAEIEEAARAAQIHDVISALPSGYDTVVGSRGHRFSGGERQRIAIARTILRNPRILVLDEATSALDTRTERAVQNAFDELARGRTTLVIAHRLSTVREADQIVVLDQGRIVESGTHDSLMKHNGRYAVLAA
ncbi:MAG TPA: ABC transporter ATP-binding protein [Pedococcus sp.]|nr:ABC transporter ATP-binding protein [Pedococcus sp.]